MSKRFAKGAAVVVLSVALGLLAMRLLRPSEANNANHPEGVLMICTSCSQTWTLTLRQISDHHVAHYGEPLPCPACGKQQGVAAQRDAVTGAPVSERQVAPHTTTSPTPR